MFFAVLLKPIKFFYCTLNTSFRLIMKFILKPSLEHMALTKIVISLWNKNDIRALISKLNYVNLPLSEWKKIEDRVTENVPLFPLPQLLKEKVLGFIKPIGLQISEWMEFHHKHFDLFLNLPAEFCWTPHGTVDRKRTAEVLVRGENLDISTRYRLACIYCLEDDIQKFWNKMPEDLKESDWYEFPIIHFWSNNMKRIELGNVHISYKDEFDRCACFGNKAAAEYFLPKLTPGEKEDCLIEASKHAADATLNTLNADFFCFILSEMDTELEMAVFKSETCGVLQCFLQWPWQSFFIGVANCMWDFLSEETFDHLLINIVRKVSDGYKYCNYQKIFTEFWQESPNALKKFITDGIAESYLLPSLIHIKDKENIRLILKDVTNAVKEKFIYSDRMLYSCISYICDNEWDFLKFCIRECLPSKNSMLKFKEDFEKLMTFSSSTEHFETMKHKWGEIFLFSEEPTSKYGKRSVEEGESSSSKRFHSLE